MASFSWYDGLKINKESAMTMPAGTYWIGDLCYVMHERWDAFCNATIVGHDVLSGEMKVGDTLVASYGTMYGDGEYTDQNGRAYGVDAGLIGCILLSDIDQSVKGNDIALGHVVTFTEPFHTGSNAGTIHFGRLEIQTGDSDDEEEEEPEYEEDEEDEEE